MAYSDKREFPPHMRGPRQNQRIRFEGLGNAYDLRQDRPQGPLVYRPGLGAAAETPGVYPIQPGQQLTPSDQAQQDDGYTDAKIIPSASPWMLSVGRKPYPVTVERAFTHIIANPQAQISIGQDFVLTEIVCKVIPNTYPSGAAGGLPGSYELNIRINRKYLFSDNVPLYFFPEAPFSLQLPCPYYLPKGTEIVIDGLADPIWAVGQNQQGQPQGVWFGFYGYFVIQAPPRDVMHLLARPMFYVRRFDRITADAATAVQLGALPIDREVKMFELNRLICVAGQANATPIIYPILPGCDQNLTIADIFTFQNMLCNWRMLWGTNYRFADMSEPAWIPPAQPPTAVEFAIMQMPRYVSPPVKTCAGSSMLINYSEALAQAYNRYTYFIIGGKHVYD